jgi:hypothetical protein
VAQATRDLSSRRVPDERSSSAGRVDVRPEHICKRVDRDGTRQGQRCALPLARTSSGFGLIKAIGGLPAARRHALIRRAFRRPEEGENIP